MIRKVIINSNEWKRGQRKPGRPDELTAAFVKTIKEPGRYADRASRLGLSLLVAVNPKTGVVSKSWSQLMRIEGKRYRRGLGRYPITTLASARRKALGNLRQIDEGVDLRVKPTAIPTFAEAVEIVIAEHKGIWREGGRHTEIWRKSLEQYAYPTLRDTPIDKINTADLRNVLIPIWATKNETARRLKRRFSTIFKWAIGAEHRTDDPAGVALDASLPRVNKASEHQRAIHHSDMADTLAKIEDSAAWPTTKLAFRFLALTGCRSGEVRLAQWDEVDLDDKTWRIPGERTKTGRPHDVPLSNQAVEVLNAARELSDGSGLVFPSQRGKPMSDNTLSKMLRDLDIPGTPHGCRSTLRDWCAENGVSREVAEAILAHVVKGVEGAYFRSDLYQQRARVMQQWAEYVLG